MDAGLRDFLAQVRPRGKDALIEERRSAPCSLSVGGPSLAQYRSADGARPQPHNGREFYRHVQQLLASQPRTVTGYRSRLAAVEELCKQVDAEASRYPGEK
jgi:hypothetical protein